MKKYISLIMVVLICILPITTIANTNEQGVITTFSTTESYTITIPATLSPGESGTVTLSGTWASNQTIKVTADSEVVLTNTKNASETLTINVSFKGIEAIGNDSEKQTFSETISIDNANVLFGTWIGVVNYNVEIVKDMVNFTIDNTPYEVVPGTTWIEWVNNGNNPVKCVMDTNNEKIIGCCGMCYLGTSDYFFMDCTAPIITGEYKFIYISPESFQAMPCINSCGPQLEVITFTIDGKEYNSEKVMTWGEWIKSEYNTDKYVNDGLSGTGIPVVDKNGNQLSDSTIIYHLNVFTLDTSSFE